METATSAPIEEQPQQQIQYQSALMNSGQSSAPAMNITPEEEARILGQVKTPEQTYQGLEDALKQSEEEIKSIGVEGMWGPKLVFYNTLDKLGLYSKECLIAKEIKKVNKQVAKLEKLRGQYEKTAENARNKTTVSDFDKYHAEEYVQDCDGSIENLEQELVRVKSDGRTINDLLKKGNTTPELKMNFYRLKGETRKLKEDIRTYARKRNRAAAQIIKADSKSAVCKTNAIKWEIVSDAIDDQYDRLDIIKAGLEDLVTISKENKGVSLLDAMSIMKNSEKQGVVVDGAAQAV